MAKMFLVPLALIPQATPRRNFRDTIGPGLPRNHELHRCEPLAVGNLDMRE